MDEHAIEREYKYTYSLAELVFWSLFISFLVAIALGGVYVSLTGHQPLRMEGGGPPPRSRADHLMLWCTSLFLLGVAAIFAAFVRRMSRGRGRRIAFTPAGILLPRDRFSSEEEFVPYRDILAWNFRQIHGEVTFLDFYASGGRFSIARQKLWRAQFDEICTTLLLRIREVRERASPQPLGPASPVAVASAASPVVDPCPGCGTTSWLDLVICPGCGHDRRIARGPRSAHQNDTIPKDDSLPGLFRRASARMLEHLPADAPPAMVRRAGLGQLARGIVGFLLWFGLVVGLALTLERLFPRGVGGRAWRGLDNLLGLAFVLFFFPAGWSAVKAFIGLVQCLTGVPFAGINDRWTGLSAGAKLMSVPLIVAVTVPFVLAVFVGSLVIVGWAAGFGRP